MLIKCRVWNGEQYISPDYIDRNGIAHWKENSIPESSSETELFTGKHDSQGVEIYEGDIIGLNYGMPPTLAKFIIEWVDDYEVFEHDCCSYFACGWIMRPQGKEPSSMLTTFYLTDITIIGTIHDSEA